MPGHGGGYFARRSPRGARTRDPGVRARHPQGDRQRQRHGTNQLRSLALGPWAARLALQRAPQARAERLHRELQQQTSRRMPQRARLPHARRGARNDRGMASRLQSLAAARQSRRLDADRVGGAKRTGSAKARRGPTNRRTLLMIGWKLGSRPAAISAVEDATERANSESESPQNPPQSEHEERAVLN